MIRVTFGAGSVTYVAQDGKKIYSSHKLDEIVLDANDWGVNPHNAQVFFTKGNIKVAQYANVIAIKRED